MKLTAEQQQWFRAQGAVGGATAALNMTAKARKKRAQTAARKRWGKSRKAKQ